MARDRAGILQKRWIKPLIALVIAGVLMVAVAVVFQIDTAPKSVSVDAFTAYLDERIPKMMNAYDIPGTGIALVKEGNTVWTKAYGYADVEAGRKMTTGDYLRVQSISKSVTAWGVIKLVEQGKIELDRPVNSYIKNWAFPESSFSSDKITVRQLLSHTAGLYIGDFMIRYSPTEPMPTLKENLLKEAVLIKEPGLSFYYSNVGYNLLELLIEEVTGRDFAEYMEQEVLLPLGMNDASFNWREDFDPPVPLGYNLQSKAIPVYVYSHKASGGLFATVEDIAAFTAASMRGSGQQILSEQSRNSLYIPVVKNMGMYSLVFDGYGFGHYIENLEDGRFAVAHGGQGTGWMTHFHAVPETGDGIVILTNSQRSWPFIAYILGDWARWSGLPSVGMGRIALGVYIMWTLIGLMWFFVLWQALRLADGMIRGKRCFAPLSKPSRVLRIVQFCLFVVIAAGLFWCVSQDYLTISSIFPIAAVGLGISAFAIAVMLLLSALLPKKVYID